MDRRMATSIYQPDIHIRLCPSSPRSNGSRRNFFHECALRAPYDARIPRTNIPRLFALCNVMAEKERERETDLNTLIPLISRVGSFKVSNGERFRLIKKEKTWLARFRGEFAICCFPVIDYPLDIARYL